MYHERIIADSTAQHSTAQHSTAQHSTAQVDNVICLILYCGLLKHIKPMDKEYFLYPSVLCAF